MAIVPCKETGCESRVQARGMCNTHYSYWRRATKGRADKTHTKMCAHCSQPFATTTKRVVFCSLTCSQHNRNKKPTDLMKYRRPKAWLGCTLPPRDGQALTAGQCAYCPNYFVGAGGSRYCSDKCSSNAAWKRRYDRRGEFKVTDKLRLAVYERDQFTCQLCNQPVDVTLHYQDMRAATLDHIIPQSHMLIPDHSMTNLRLAHRLCNSRRGDRTEG